MAKSKYGLDRKIPDKDKRKIRKRCGFGCVKCGSAIIEYHHFDIPFKDAKEHNVDRITALCPTCHKKVHKGLLSMETIKKAITNPYCCRVGFSRDEFDINNPMVHLGTLTAQVSQSILELNHESILKIEPAEEQGGPNRFSAIFHDKKGRLIASIRRNEWNALNDNWDIRNVGNDFEIWSDSEDISLKICFNPPREIFIKRLNMYYKGYRAYINNEEALEIHYPNGEIIVNGAACLGCVNAFSF